MKKIYFILSLFLCFQGNASIQDSLDYKIGKKTFEMVKQTYGIYHNDSLLTIVKEVGQQLEKHLTFSQPLQYFLVDTPEPNAFATAGGYVYVTRGLLAILNSKDELAGIMGHEISHVTQKHPQKMMEAKLIPLVLELPGQLAGVVSGPVMGRLIKMPVQITSGIALASFSRKQEKEADILGAQLAIKAGFEPYGLIVGLESLTNYIETFLHHKMPKNILIDHPTTEDRVAYLTELLQSQGYYRKPTPSGTNLASLNGLTYGYDNKYGTVVKDSLYIHPVHSIKTTIPKKWQMDIANNLFICMSKDKKSSLHIDYDSLIISFSDYVRKYTSKIASKYILKTDSNFSGVLPYYRMEVYFPGKDVNVWISLYECKMSNSVAKVVGLSSKSADDTELKNSVNNVQLYHPSDKLLSHTYLELVPASFVHEWSEVEPDSNTTRNKMTQIINGVKDTHELNTTRLYFKKIKIAN
jgi:predicted Zn-dependent protease